MMLTSANNRFGMESPAELGIMRLAVRALLKGDPVAKDLETDFDPPNPATDAAAEYRLLSLLEDTLDGRGDIITEAAEHYRFFIDSDPIDNTDKLQRVSLDLKRKPPTTSDLGQHLTRIVALGVGSGIRWGAGRGAIGKMLINTTNFLDENSSLWLMLVSRRGDLC